MSAPPSTGAPCLAPQSAAAPTTPLLTLDEIKAYECNPRRTPHPGYRAIKEPIRARGGLLSRLAVRRRSGEACYLLAAGGNICLAALRALHEETGRARFFALPGVWRPWVAEAAVLSARLIEHGLRGELAPRLGSSAREAQAATEPSAEAALGREVRAGRPAVANDPVTSQRFPELPQNHPAVTDGPSAIEEAAPEIAPRGQLQRARDAVSAGAAQPRTGGAAGGAEPPAPPPYAGPRDARSLRSRNYVLALRIAQRHRLASHLTSIPRLGMGLTLDLPAALSDAGTQDPHRRWIAWLLASFSKQTARAEHHAMVDAPDWPRLAQQCLSDPRLAERSFEALWLLAQSCRQLRRSLAAERLEPAEGQP